MDPKAVFKYCKDLGCCEACCLRYIGIKNPSAYENVANFVIKYQNIVDTKPVSAVEQNQTPPLAQRSADAKEDLLDVGKNNIQNVNGKSLDVDGKEISNGDNSSPPCKKRRLDVCVSCLGVLQEDNWTEGYVLVKDILFKKRYESKTFACALSAPIATLLRERAVILHLAEEFPGYDDKTVTALKEAWKWSFGVKLAAEIDRILDSGAVSPLLITLNYDYVDDLQELEILKQISPQMFEERSKQRRRFVTEFTRRSVEQALESASLASLRAAGGGLRAAAAGARARCVAAACTHAPAYLAGRYMKLSRNLPQSPWILDGKRVLPSSVQEIIYRPLADFYNLQGEEAERRLKLLAAGREDVDVRCLGGGRPFAVEITDPIRQLSPEELAKACEEISKSGEVIVKQIVPITKEDLVQLKKGEETKSKTYEALCIKLSHSKYDDVSPDSPIKVTPEDIARINSFRNTPQSTSHNTNNAQINTTSKDINKTVDSTKSSKNVLESESTDTSGDVLDNNVCTSVQENENLNNSEDIKDPDTNQMQTDIESRNVKDNSADILDTSNSVLKAENLDISKDVKDSEMDKSVNVREAEIPNLQNTSETSMGTLNGVQKTDNRDISENLKEIGDVLDTTDEITEPEISDSPGDAKITIQQKTPIRVLHRRPLLTRTRQILELKAEAVPDHPQLFRIFVRTSAGTYVKEWAHGELGRSRPALGDAMGARVDMLALDVTAVHLTWPPR